LPAQALPDRKQPALKTMKEKSIRKISYRSCDSTGQPIPSLIIQGKFLESFGFYRGGHVLIRYTLSRIEITSASPLLINHKIGGDYNDGIQILLPSPALNSYSQK
jgi:hypothetical protein